MHSEFITVPLDTIHYSLVWEDWQTLYTALAVQTTDHVAAITSAGDNVLNLLLRTPRQVTALDLNPMQNHLLRFKCHLIEHHDYATLAGLLGLAGPAGVMAAWDTAQATLTPADREYWAACLARNPAGLLTAGRLEAYLTVGSPVW